MSANTEPEHEGRHRSGPSSAAIQAAVNRQVIRWEGLLDLLAKND